MATFAPPAAAEDDLKRRSHRTRRLARHLKRVRNEELNIVSMIDVFAVLVFFLLVSSSISAARLNVLSMNLPSDDQSMPVEDKALRLTVALLPEAIEISDRNGPLRRLDNTPDGYNVLALSEVLVEAKKAAPQESSLTLLVSPEVSYDNLVKVMDAARLAPAEARALGLPRELFPQISIGDVAPSVSTGGGAP
ncbi:MAG TPA: biopolymer transporter ExbD [Nevskiaceae bacterium]|nr:biopolymer transporter ExbD [Nevskiaceae bacterium]